MSKAKERYEDTWYPLDERYDYASVYIDELEKQNEDLKMYLCNSRRALKASHYELQGRDSMNRHQVLDAIESNIINIEEILK